MQKVFDALDLEKHESETLFCSSVSLINVIKVERRKLDRAINWKPEEVKK